MRLKRDESCGGHFREEHQTPDGEALRNDEEFAAVFAWEYPGQRQIAAPKLHREPLEFETVETGADEATNELQTQVWRQKEREDEGQAR